MKINRILLENFGSYEGVATFETREQDGKNIILIGGKNGAGKTTLFTAMRLCLYGFMSMGYKSHNAYYSRAITKLINNTVKMTKPAVARVEMDISISNGQRHTLAVVIHSNHNKMPRTTATSNQRSY
jgi:DNA sulfur modification protein DndD